MMLSPKVVNQTLYGEEHYRKTSLAFPTNLSKLQERIGPYVDMTPRELIEKTTLFSFYFAVAPQAIREATIKSMLKPIGKKRLQQGYKRLIRQVNACPECVQSDFEQYGEAYWHRAHQVEGVHYCWIHAIELHKVETKYFNTNLNHLEVLTTSTPMHRYLPPHSERTRQLLHEIARRANQCLQNDVKEMRKLAIYPRYKEMVLRLYRLRNTGSIDHKAYLRDFVDFFGEQLLALLELEVGALSKDHWPSTILQQRTDDKPGRTIKNILMQIFLEARVKPRIVDTPGGPSNVQHDGPWNCQNPSADHFGEPTIMNASRTPRYHQTRMLKYVCSCGYSFIAKETAWTRYWQPKKTQVISFGPQFVELVRRLRSEGRPVREISDRMGIHHSLVYKMTKLGYRVKERPYPTAAQAALKTKFAAIPAKEIISRSRRVDHGQRDEHNAQKIIATRKKALKSKPPSRVTKRLLRTDLQLANSTLANLAHLYPKTIEALKVCSETTIAYHERIRKAA